MDTGFLSEIQTGIAVVANQKGLEEVLIVSGISFFFYFITYIIYL